LIKFINHLNNMDLYAYQILDHYKNPRNYGELVNADASSEQANRSCGDNIVMYVKMSGNDVSELKFTGQGCAVSSASASMLTEKLKGKTKDEILNMGIDDVRQILGIEISDRRANCALIGLTAIQTALRKII